MGKVGARRSVNCGSESLSFGAFLDRTRTCWFRYSLFSAQDTLHDDASDTITYERSRYSSHAKGVLPSPTPPKPEIPENRNRHAWAVHSSSMGGKLDYFPDILSTTGPALLLAANSCGCRMQHASPVHTTSPAYRPRRRSDKRSSTTRRKSLTSPPSAATYSLTRCQSS